MLFNDKNSTSHTNMQTQTLTYIAKPSALEVSQLPRLCANSKQNNPMVCHVIDNSLNTAHLLFPSFF